MKPESGLTVGNTRSGDRMTLGVYGDNGDENRLGVDEGKSEDRVGLGSYDGGLGAVDGRPVDVKSTTI